MRLENVAISKKRNDFGLKGNPGPIYPWNSLNFNIKHEFWAILSLTELEKICII